MRASSSFSVQAGVLGNFVALYSIMAAIFVPGPVVGIELLCGGLSLVLLTFLPKRLEELKSRPAGTRGDPRLLLALVMLLLLLLQVPFLLRPALPWMLICVVYAILVFHVLSAEKRIRATAVIPLQLYILSFFGAPLSLSEEALLFAAGCGLAMAAWGMAGLSARKEAGRGTSAVLGAMVTASLLLTYFPLSDVSGSDAARASWLLPFGGWVAIAVQMARSLRQARKAPSIRRAVEAYGALLLAGTLVAAIFG